MRFSLCFCMYSVVRFHCVGNKISKNLCAIVFNLQFISLIFFICIQDTHLYASIWALYGCVCVCRGTLYYFSFLEPVFFFFFRLFLENVNVCRKVWAFCIMQWKWETKRRRKTQRIWAAIIRWSAFLQLPLDMTYIKIINFGKKKTSSTQSRPNTSHNIFFFFAISFINWLLFLLL